MAKATIFVSWPGYAADDPETGARLVDAGYAVRLEPKHGARSEDELIALMGSAAGAIVSTDPFTARAIAANPALRVIARVGVGTDSIDRAAADRAGIAIAVTPGMNAETVADHTLALILALVRKVVEQDASVKAGRWDRVGRFAPSELPGKTVGLVGAGTIGKAVARRLAGFGVRIAYYDAFVAALDGARKMETLDALLSEADIVSLHAPATAETHRMISAAALARMKPSALLVNTARGSLVDQAALFAALRAGRIAGAALDVFDREPPGSEALAGIPNLVVSAHLAGLSHESIRRMTISATDSVLAVLAGGIPDTVINAEAVRARTAGG